jgi:hypothetical protein
VAFGQKLDQRRRLPQTPRILSYDPSSDRYPKAAEQPDAHRFEQSVLSLAYLALSTPNYTPRPRIPEHRLPDRRAYADEREPV